MNHICLNRNTTPFEVDETVFKNFKTGKTYDDWLNGLTIVLSAEQNAFRLENINASVKEIIEMQLEPPPPDQETTLEEHKDSAISQIEIESENKLNEILPVREAIDNIMRILSNLEDAYIAEYVEKRDEITLSATMAKEAVREAGNVSEIRTAIDSMNELSAEIVTRPPEIGIGGKIRM